MECNLYFTDCTCLKGTCNASPFGDGKCTKCDEGYTGSNCDIQSVVCNIQLHQCHAHALCYWFEEDLDFK